MDVIESFNQYYDIIIIAEIMQLVWAFASDVEGRVFESWSWQTYVDRTGSESFNVKRSSEMTLKRCVTCHSINILDVARYRTLADQLPCAWSLSLQYSTGYDGVSI